MLQAETRKSRVERLRSSNAEREMGFESPRCSGSSRTFSSLLSPRPDTNITANAGKDYIDNAAVAGSNPACPARAVAQSGRAPALRGVLLILVAVTHFKLANAGGTTSCHDAPFGDCLSRLSSPEPNSKLANAGGTTGQSARSDAGGRRSDSASGKPDSSRKCLANARRRQTAEARRMPTGLHRVKGGSNPPLERKLGRMSRHSVVAAPRLG